MRNLIVPTGTYQIIASAIIGSIRVVWVTVGWVMAKSGSSVEMPNGWEAWFWANPSRGWSFEMRHKSGDQVGGNQRSEEMARKVAGIIADTTHVEPPKPADPAWMVEVAREGCAIDAEAQSDFVAPARYRAGDWDHRIAVTSSLAALRLALERRHVVEARTATTEEELLKASREDAAQACRDHHQPNRAGRIRAGELDGSDEVQAALQARRSMLREMGAAAAPAAPAIDLEAALKRAWDIGWNAAKNALFALECEDGNATTLRSNQRESDVSSILSTLPAKE